MNSGVKTLSPLGSFWLVAAGPMLMGASLIFGFHFSAAGEMGRKALPVTSVGGRCLGP